MQACPWVSVVDVDVMREDIGGIYSGLHSAGDSAARGAVQVLLHAGVGWMDIPFGVEWVAGC